ncbi:hypothetical protein MKZ38_007047 [Zalerion maritima]|uniref:Myb-like domain-containing protein n=1 Tax=Zalerion maritima TaxID=339359 RepID=A0AAD5RX24_9PEZI|nr:hypothetical protein MKZ38_007047 [Zalerion maritima]
MTAIPIIPAACADTASSAFTAPVPLRPHSWPLGPEPQLLHAPVTMSLGWLLVALGPLFCIICWHNYFYSRGHSTIPSTPTRQHEKPVGQHTFPYPDKDINLEPSVSSMAMADPFCSGAPLDHFREQWRYGNLGAQFLNGLSLEAVQAAYRSLWAYLPTIVHGNLIPTIESISSRFILGPRSQAAHTAHLLPYASKFGPHFPSSSSPLLSKMRLKIYFKFKLTFETDSKSRGASKCTRRGIDSEPRFTDILLGSITDIPNAYKAKFAPVRASAPSRHTARKGNCLLSTPTPTSKSAVATTAKAPVASPKTAGKLQSSPAAKKPYLAIDKAAQNPAAEEKCKMVLKQDSLRESKKCPHRKKKALPETSSCTKKDGSQKDCKVSLKQGRKVHIDINVLPAEIVDNLTGVGKDTIQLRRREGGKKPKLHSSDDDAAKKKVYTVEDSETYTAEEVVLSGDEDIIKEVTELNKKKNLGDPATRISKKRRELYRAMGKKWPKKSSKPIVHKLTPEERENVRHNLEVIYAHSSAGREKIKDASQARDDNGSKENAVENNQEPNEDTFDPCNKKSRRHCRGHKKGHKSGRRSSNHSHSRDSIGEMKRRHKERQRAAKFFHDDSSSSTDGSEDENLVSKPRRCSKTKESKKKYRDKSQEANDVDGDSSSSSDSPSSSSQYSSGDSSGSGQTTSSGSRGRDSGSSGDASGNSSGFEDTSSNADSGSCSTDESSSDADSSNQESSQWTPSYDAMLKNLKEEEKMPWEDIVKTLPRSDSLRWTVKGCQKRYGQLKKAEYKEASKGLRTEKTSKKKNKAEREAKNKKKKKNAESKSKTTTQFTGTDTATSSSQDVQTGADGADDGLFWGLDIAVEPDEPVGDQVPHNVGPEESSGSEIKSKKEKRERKKGERKARKEREKREKEERKKHGKDKSFEKEKQKDATSEEAEEPDAKSEEKTAGAVEPETGPSRQYSAGPPYPRAMARPGPHLDMAQIPMHPGPPPCSHGHGHKPAHRSRNHGKPCRSGCTSSCVPCTLPCFQPSMAMAFPPPPAMPPFSINPYATPPYPFPAQPGAYQPSPALPRVAAQLGVPARVVDESEHYHFTQQYAKMYKPDLELEPDEWLNKKDCEALGIIDKKTKVTKWLELQAAMWNATGKKIPVEVLREKIETARAKREEEDGNGDEE